MRKNDFFELRDKGISRRIKIQYFIGGSMVLIILWVLVTELQMVPKGILPSPIKIILAFPELHSENGLVRNAFYSFKLNILGLAEAALCALPIGFIIGLNSRIRAMFEPYISALRYLPLTAVLGLFMAWFGIEMNMKVQFLAFSIFLYLLPVVVQRIDEVEDVYDQTLITLGASKWKRIRFVFWPAVISRVWDDIRVLGALSWTYIIVAEMVNTSGGGIGALSYIAARQSRVDKVFAILISIMIIGVLWDKIHRWSDKLFFPFKYATKGGDNGRK